MVARREAHARYPLRGKDCLNRQGGFADLHEWRQLDIRRVFEGDDGDGDAAISKLYSEDEARLARGEKGDGGALLTQLLDHSDAGSTVANAEYDAGFQALLGGAQARPPIPALLAAPTQLALDGGVMRLALWYDRKKEVEERIWKSGQVGKVPPGSRSPQEAAAWLVVQRAQWFFDEAGWLCCRTPLPLPPSSAASFWLATEARVRTTESLPNRSECAFVFDHRCHARDRVLPRRLGVGSNGRHSLSDRRGGEGGPCRALAWR